MRLIDTTLGCFILLTSAFLGSTASAWAKGPETDALVNCHDAARGLVTRTRPDACQGRVVSNEAAAAIRQRRQAYVKESLSTNVSPSVLGQRLAGVGAGFFVDDKGTLLTNAHIVKGCSTLTLSPPGQASRPARLGAMDLALDLAVLETNLRPRQHAVFAADRRPVSGEIAILGYPSQGQAAPNTPTLTKGTLANTSDARHAMTRPLLLKAAVRPGNSGGPVLDGSGHVVGVVFAAVDTQRTYQQTGRLARNTGMAIPNSVSLRFLKRNGIQPSVADAPRAPPDLLQEAEGYLARIECWL